MWLLPISCLTKAKLWLILEITLDQYSLTIGLHLKSELLTPYNHNTYVTSYGCLPNFGPFQRPPLGLFPRVRAKKKRPHWKMKVASVNLAVITATIPGAMYTDSIDAHHTKLKSPSNLYTPCAFELSKIGIQLEITTTQIEYCWIQIWGIQYMISSLCSISTNWATSCINSCHKITGLSSCSPFLTFKQKGHKKFIKLSSSKLLAGRSLNKITGNVTHWHWKRRGRELLTMQADYGDVL